ncbi:MAG TPA: hypothetical protein VNI52_00890 [Sphingobacteriaceae bacterium]|nr:hypothetical protein [Sphingobacteriaceae bacterium]
MSKLNFLILILFLIGCSSKTVQKNEASKIATRNCSGFILKKTGNVSESVNIEVNVVSCIDRNPIGGSLIIVNNHLGNKVGEFKTYLKGEALINLPRGIYSIICVRPFYGIITTSTTSLEPGTYKVTFNLGPGDVLVH